MNTYKTILVIVSPERQLTPAFHRATELARRCGATLHLCMFAYHELIDAARAMVGAEVAQLAESEFVKQRMAWLAEQAAALAGPALRVECDVVWAPVAHEAILGKMLEIGADLVVKDVTCDKRTPQRLHMSSLDWRLSRLAPATLMFVRPDAALLPRKAVAAVQVATPSQRDPQLNDRILTAAFDLSRVAETSLDVVSVFSYMPVENDAVAYTPAIYDLVNQAHREAFEKLMSAYPLPAERQHRYFGEPAEAIRQAARELEADLIVLGSSYHSGWNRLLFGSTADSLLRDVCTDVLIVKPDGFLDELGRHIDLGELRKRYARVQAEMPAVS
jgi:universal stress protein E